MRKRKQKGLRISNFALLLVVFKCHHGSERVKAELCPEEFRRGPKSRTECGTIAHRTPCCRHQNDSALKMGSDETHGDYLIIIITEICKAPTLRLKAPNKHSITHIMYTEMEMLSVTKMI